MKRYFIDYPVYFSLKDYTNTISSLIENIQQEKNVISIYQIGHIANPGISDIDILVIFENDFKSMIDPLKNSNRKEKYLLVHNLFGTSRNYFKEAQKFSFFHNYKHLYGQEMEIGNTLNHADNDIIKHQIALEYLLQFYVSFSIQKKYGIYKVRNILLTVKALMYDLEFLGVNDGVFYDLVNQILVMRKNWFQNNLSIKEINNWCDDFDECFPNFIQNLFIEKKLYLPGDSNFHPSRNISFFHSDYLKYLHDGIVLPNRFGFFGRKYFNVQNRLNKFKVGIPFIDKKIPKILSERFDSIRNMKNYNNKNLPHFMPLISSLGIV